MTNQVTGEALLEQARDLIPVLRERGAKTEQDRRVPDETFQTLFDAGFFKFSQAERWGGLELPYNYMFETATALARGCGSTGWIFTNLSTQGWVNGMADPKAQEDLWGQNQDTLICSGFPAKGAKVEKSQDGVVLEGTWSFCSGIDFADWLNLQVFVPKEEGGVEPYFMLLPRSEGEVVDDWFPSGLAGTGSRSIKLKKTEVPFYRQLALADVRGGSSPGTAINPGPLYRYPIMGIGVKIFSGPALGCGYGALDAMVEDMGGRKGSLGPTLADLPSVHLRLAESSADLDAAHALLLRDIEEVHRIVLAGGNPPIEDRARWRRNDAWAVKTTLAAIERLFALSGGRGLPFASPFQRAWRDAHAASCQFHVAWDPQAITFGRAMLGLPMTDARI